MRAIPCARSKITQYTAGRLVYVERTVVTTGAIVSDQDQTWRSVHIVSQRLYLAQRLYDVPHATHPNKSGTLLTVSNLVYGER